MSETFEEYKQRRLDDVHTSAQAEGTTYDDYFLRNTLDQLQYMNEVPDYTLFSVNKIGRNNRKMGFDAYAFDEADNSLVLISNEYRDSLDDPLNMTDINKAISRMINFVDEAYCGSLSRYFDMYDDAIGLGKMIAGRMDPTFDMSTESPIDRIKLIIMTNQDISGSVKSLPNREFEGKQVSVNIWGIRRFYELDQSGREREPVTIKTENFGIDGIKYLKAEMNGNLDYDAYLAIVPGEFLHKIYYQFGSQLLEGNVRAFLSNRGKINKGIRETIAKEPTKFFTYNNGIACTAADVKFSEDGSKIVEIDDLQIINGGQTTASLTYAVTKDRRPLDNIFVQMKLTVVRQDDYETMIQNISKFSNSQNKVTDADFFSNHAFHRKFAELAAKNAAVVGEGIATGSYWYYERSRGKYEQEQFRLTTVKQRNEFKSKYPKNQIIRKDELAKYYLAAEKMRPDVVSLGATKAMRFFGALIDDEYAKHPEDFNNEFYRRCICYAIIYRETDRIVSKASWYNVGGYKLNIVPYTVSKLMSMIPSGYTLDFGRIWKKQEMYPSLAGTIKQIAPVTNEFIKDSGNVIVTEYCKKQATWNKYRDTDINIPLSFDFRDDLVSSVLNEEERKAERKDEKENMEINILKEIYGLGPKYWGDLRDEGIRHGLLSEQDISLLNVAASIGRPGANFPSDGQCKKIWKIRERLGERGMIV